MIEKNYPYQSKKWLAAVHCIDCCVLCGRHGIQVAHRNEGKGMGMKTSDCLTAAICPNCHTEIDHGKHLSKEERRQKLDKAILLTIEKLVKLGKVVPV